MKNGWPLIFGLMLAGCGVDVTNEKFRDEKNDRLEAEENLRAEKSENELLVEMLKNFVQTNTYQWAYVSSKTGDPINLYADAEGLCQKIGFDLPTAVMVNGEGATVDGIMNMAVDGKDLESWVFIRDDKEDKGFRYLVCARELP